MSIRRDRRHGPRDVRLLLAAFLIAGFASAAEIPYEWTGVDRVVAVADLHGDYDQFVFILTHPKIGLLDADLRWAGGRTHLVQLGDVMDRGLRARAILDLLMRLEKEAADAGGMVHMILGNHEEMNITGISLDYPGYVPVEQFVAFLPEDFRREREAQYVKSLPPQERARAEVEGLDIFADEGLRAFWQNVMDIKDHEAQRAYVLGFNDVYGDWLVRKNSVIKINDIVYVHGGLNETLSKWPLREINQVIRDELEFFQGRMRNPQQFARPFHPKLVYDPDSPLWFRGLAKKNEAAAEAELDRILANIGARALVVGHNYFAYPGGRSPIVTKDFVARFNDKLWIMDTGISGYSFGGPPSALIVEKGLFEVWGETEELAARSGIRPPPPKPLTAREMETFLRNAAIAGRGAGPGGRTDAWKLTLESGDIVLPALFKYIDRRRPDPLADSYRYDLAAYALNKYLGLNFVPSVVERSVENVAGAVQVFVADGMPLREFREGASAPRDPEAIDKALADLTILQALAHDDCRDDKDTLVSGDGKIYRVDFSEAFAPTVRDAPGCTIRRCSRLLYRRLLAWDDKRVANYLGRYLGREEIDALNRRADIVVRQIRQMIRTLGEGNVLF
jgi:hypothetical protein